MKRALATLLHVAIFAFGNLFAQSTSSGANAALAFQESADQGSPFFSASTGSGRRQVSWPSPDAVNTLPNHAMASATLVSDTVTLCSGSTDTLTIIFSGTGPYIFVYSENSVFQPQDTSLTDTIRIVVHPPANPTVYNLVSMQDAMGGGTVSGTYQVNLIQSPIAVLMGLDTVCSGQTANLTVSFTGSGPYTFNYTANNVAQTAVQSLTNPYILQVNPTVTTTYMLTSVQANSCTGTVSGSGKVVVPPAPSGIISGGGQICQNGSGTDVTVTLTGTAPFTFIYSANNVPQMPITTNQNVYTFHVNPPIGTGYRLVSVTDAFGCTGTFSGIAQVFVFAPASAEMSGDATFCDSAATTIMVDFNGSGPFTIEYTVNNVLQPPVFTSDDPFLLPVQVYSTTTYALTMVESPGCTGIPSGTATITIHYAPGFANVNLNCNPAQNNYTVTFDVLNGTPPYTLVSGSGVFSGNQFTSNPIPQGTDYNFIFHDANNCGNVTVTGPNTCNCTSGAGAMNLTPAEACISGNASATYLGPFVSDGDDSLRFVLHSNPALPFGAIYGWNTTPVFTFQPGMTVGTTYYISAVAGNWNGSSQIDLNDPCLSVAQGTPVTFFAAPQADLATGNYNVCMGDSVSLAVTLSGAPVFSLQPEFNLVAQPPVSGINTGMFNLVVHPVQDMTVTLGNVSDQHCSSGMVSGTANIHITPPPMFGPEQIVCDYATSSYTVVFGVTGTPPYNLSNLLATYNGTVFTSLPIPIGTPYFTYLTDAGMCGQDTLSGMDICVCLSDAGTMSQTLVNACQSGTLTVPPATGTTLEPGDSLLYIIHTNPGLPLGTILGWSTTPNFMFGNGMMAGVTYYVSSVVGNPDGSGMIDLMDPCLSVATGTPVQWYAAPTAMLTTGTFNICPGGAQALLVTLTGTPNYVLHYTSNGTPFTVFPTQNLFSINAQLQQSATFVLTSITDSHGCSGTVSGQADVIVHPTPLAGNITPTCDLNNQVYTIEFDLTAGDKSTAVVSSPAGFYDSSTGHFISNPIPIGQPYTISIKDSWMCGAYNHTDSVMCVCTTMAGTMPGSNLALCPGDLAVTSDAVNPVLDPGDTLVYLLVNATSPATWTILGVNASPTFAFNPASMMYDTTYYIVAAAGNILNGMLDLNDPCFSSHAGPSVVWRTPVTATISGTDTICAGGSALLPIHFTGSGPFSISYSDGSTNQVMGNITQNPYMLSVTPGATSTYTLSGVSGAGFCTGTVSGSATVEVHTMPQAVNVVESCDLNTETYVLTFDISNGATPNAGYSVIGIQGSIQDTTFTSIAYPGNQAYLVTITDEIGCSSSISGQPNCVCMSIAGSLGNIQNACLPNGQITAQSNGDSHLDPNDLLHYFLCTDPALMPGSILAENNTAQFSFNAATMKADTTYYLLIGVGNGQPNGSLDFNDPCLSLSSGFPVVFHSAPTAYISDTLTACPGANAVLPIQFTGQQPFHFQVALNGSPLAASNTNNNPYSLNAINIQEDRVYTLLNVSDANCPGTVSGQGEIMFVPNPTASLSQDQTICLGDSAAITVHLSGAQYYNVTISGGGSNIVLDSVQDGAMTYITPSSTTTYKVTTLTASGNNCLSVIGNNVKITTDQVQANATVSQYNNFNVSCPNGDDGTISIAPTSGAMPYTASWSDQASGLQRSNLTSGTYAVTLTDQIGCIWKDSFSLNEPPEANVTYDVTGPVCYGDRTGFITVNGVSGGAAPFNLLLNGASQGILDTYPKTVQGLASGSYTLGVEDANGCISDDTISVPTPQQLLVDLGPDTIISFGDSLLLMAIHNAAQLDTFIWTPAGELQTPGALESWTRPLYSQRFAIYIRDNLGCEARDEVLVQVSRDKRVYLPNAIYPQSSKLNDIFTVYGGAEVSKVRFMRIYDRWGELVFENNDFAPGNPAFGWKGQFNGKYVDPAVYVYVLEVEYINGETEIFSGDVTVVR